MTSAHRIMTPFWQVFWAFTLALGWLLPNHYRPWPAFHTDAWVAAALLLAWAAVLLRSRGSWQLHPLALLVALLICVPWLQYGVRLVYQPGVAWIASTYLLGLFLALLLGAHWELNRPGELGDALFLAIGIASVFSVGLQLQQWLQLEGLELWKTGGGPARPHANLGQPNQLGTLLLWGLLAAAWGWLRQCIGVSVALLLAAYLLFGIALSGSRTAWVGVALLVGAAWVWRHLWNHSRVPWLVTGLGLYFVVCAASVGWMGNFLQAESAPDPQFFSSASGQQRLLAWAAFADALWQRPFFGYGWNQTVLAQMAVATAHPSLQGIFGHSHNLFLDLALWCGIPLGLGVSAFLLGWFWRQFRAVQCAENAVLFLLILVVANHAMLELPLHYAYFLLPTGLVVGVLNTRLAARPVLLVRRWVVLLLFLGATTLLALIIRDYSRVEPSYENLRQEGFRIQVAPIGPPEVLLLTQWHDFIRFARYEPKAGLSDLELERWRNLTGLFPSALFMHNFATILALNHGSVEAGVWLQRMCKTVSESECLNVKKIWAKQSLLYPEIAAIPWPIEMPN
jgi:O-antigen ligase